MPEPDRRRPRAAPTPRRSLTLAELLLELAAEHPDRPYLVGDERSWTYLEVVRWVGRLAGGLRRLGVSPGDRVASMLPNGPEKVALEFAIAAAGAGSLQLSPRSTAPEVEELARRTGSVLVVDAGRLPEVEAAGAGPAADATWPRPAHRELEVVFAAAHESGRTSLVPLGHDQLLRSASGSAYTRAFEDGRVILLALPLSHVFGYVEGMLAALFCGGAIVPLAAFSPGAALAAIERHRATDALLVPTMTVALLREGPAGHDLSSLRAVMSAGQAAPAWIWPALRERFGVDRLTTGYGQTETAGSSTLTGPEASDRELVETVGAPKLSPQGPLTRYRVVDPSTGASPSPGEEGELWVSGPTVARRYLDDAELSRASIRNGWLRSGDLGRRREDGSLELTGRLKLLLRTGGENVSPREVEGVLRGHPDVTGACVVGVPERRYGEMVVALVAMRPEARFDPASLRSHCLARLARHKVPRRFLEAADLGPGVDSPSNRARLRDLAIAALHRLEAGGSRRGVTATARYDLSELGE